MASLFVLTYVADIAVRNFQRVRDDAQRFGAIPGAQAAHAPPATGQIDAAVERDIRTLLEESVSLAPRSDGARPDAGLWAGSGALHQ